MTKRVLSFFHFIILSFLLPLTLCAQVATVIEDVTEVDYQSPRSCTTHHKKVVQVNNERGLDYAAFAIGCDATTTLASFSGEISYAADGKPKKIKKGQLLRTEYSSMLATDAYRFIFTPSPANYPFTITYDWTVRSTDAVLCLDVFWPQPGFDVDVKHSSYSVVHAPDVQIHHALCLPPYFDSSAGSGQTTQGQTLKEVTFSDGRPGLVLILDNLPAVKEERYLPSADKLFPHAYFVPSTFTFGSTNGSLSSWASLGQWLDELREGRDVLPEALKAKLHELTDGCADPYERLLKVYRLLEEQTRYVSIQLGIGGMQPASAADVCRKGFGDCKGLSNYMVAMLREVGIEADYVVIGTKHEDLPADFANVALLNHAIARVHMPDGEVWLECTNPQLPLGYIHSGIAGHEALVIKPDGKSEVVRLPRYTAAENVDSISIVVSLAADGSAQMTVDDEEAGMMYEVDKYLLDLDKGKQRDAIRNQLSLPNFSFTEHAVEQERREFSQGVALLRVKYSGTCQKYAAVTGSRLFVPLLPYGGPSASGATAERMNPVQFSREDYVRVYHLELLLPADCEVEHLPELLNTTTEFGSVESSVRRVTSATPLLGPPDCGEAEEDNHIVVDVRIERSSDVFPADRYPDLCAFIDKLSDCLNGKIVLKAKKK